MARPLAAELPQDPVHGGDAALRLPEHDALPVGVHGVLPDGAVEDAAAGLAEPERPLLLAIDLRRGGCSQKNRVRFGDLGRGERERRGCPGRAAREGGEKKGEPVPGRRCGRCRRGRCGP